VKGLVVANASAESMISQTVAGGFGELMGNLLGNLVNVAGEVGDDGRDFACQGAADQLSDGSEGERKGPEAETKPDICSAY
jgi:hypothetical protein